MYASICIYLSYHKSAIVENVKQQVAENLNGNIAIGNLELSFIDHFPAIAVLVENITIQDSQFTLHKHEFFIAKKIYATISIFKIILKQNPVSSIEIDSSSLYVFTDTLGYTNSYLFKPKKTNNTNSATTKFNIEKIVLKNVRLVIDDKLKNKLFDVDIQKMKCKIENDNAIMFIDSDNQILIHDLAFNLQVGSYLHEKLLSGAFQITYNTKKELLDFKGQKINIQYHPFNLAGSFSFLQNPSYTLLVSTKNIDYDFAKNLLTKKLSNTLSIVKMTKPLTSISSNISGSLVGGEPAIHIKWMSSSNNSLTTPFADFTNCIFSGSFNNQINKDSARCDENSRISILNFSGYYKNIKVLSKAALIDNLTIPNIQTDIQSTFSLSNLNNLLSSNVLHFIDGNGSLNLKYAGSLTSFTDSGTNIQGRLSFSQGKLLYKPTHIQINEANGNIVFINKDVFIENLNCFVNNNKLTINGTAKEFLSLFNYSTAKADIDWSIYSPSININKLQSIFQKNENAKPNTTTSKGNTFKLDKIISDANFRVNVKADEFIFNRLRATKLLGNFSINDERWKFNQLSLNHSGGNIFVAGELIPDNTKYNATVGVKMNNVDINKVLYAFDDFGQTGISYSNLLGKLNVIATIKMNVDRSLQEKPENINGQIDFSLKNGMLINYEPLKKIQAIIFKKRNFDEIKFAELTDRLTVNDGEVTIHKMEIQSTVITLFVEGIYSSKGKTDISIQVPLKNLQKRDENYIPQNKGSNAKTGASIYLRGQTGSDGLVQFKLDLFKKLRGKKSS